MSQLSSSSRQALLICAAASFGILTYLLFHYPGFIDSDSYWQWKQAQGIDPVNNWHPPGMQLVWSGLAKIFPNGSGYVILNTIMLWTGISIFFNLAIRRTSLVIIAILFTGFLPHIFYMAGLLNKDIPFTVGLILTFAIGAVAQKRNSRKLLVASLLFALYSMSMRHIGIIALIPYCFWVTSLLGNHFGFNISNRKRRYGIGAALCLALFGSVTALNIKLTEENSSPAQMLLMFDVARISVLSNRNYLPNFYNSKRSANDPITVEILSKVWDQEKSNFYFLFGDNPIPGFFWGQKNMKRLEAAWLSAIWNEPIPYLKHRYLQFTYQLDFAKFSGRRFAYIGIDPKHDLAPNSKNLAFRKLLVSSIKKIESLVVFQSWFYLLILGIATLALIMFGSSNLGFAWAVLLSGILNFLSLFFVGVAPFFRYVWWSSIVAILIWPLIDFGNLPQLKSRLHRLRFWQ